jgi:hypothetical protein
VIAAIDWLEVSFLIVVGTLSVLAGVFALYAASQVFRNTGYRTRRRATR